MSKKSVVPISFKNFQFPLSYLDYKEIMLLSGVWGFITLDGNFLVIRRDFFNCDGFHCGEYTEKYLDSIEKLLVNGDFIELWLNDSNFRRFAQYKMSFIIYSSPNDLVDEFNGLDDLIKVDFVVYVE